MITDLSTDPVDRSVTLGFAEHPTAVPGRRYVYPVVSRRAGGVSIGINLNTNHACNWRCVYCQVPDLVRGAAPPVDLDRLEQELQDLLQEVLVGDFMARRVPAPLRRLNDIAFAGDGEPTSAQAFAQVVERVAAVRHRLGLGQDVATVLITNGSLIHRPAVQEGLALLAKASGEVWFKVDRVDPVGMEQINGVRASPGRMARNLERAAELCPTWVQTCLFAFDGQPPSEDQLTAYLGFLAARCEAGVGLRGVLLYGPVRASCQPEAPRISLLPEAWLRAFAERIERLGLTVRLTP